MKKAICILVLSGFMAVPAVADIVNFYQTPYTNVNPGDTVNFGPNTNNLGLYSIGLLGGGATAYAQQDGANDIFSQRDVRGLGIWGQENDEVKNAGVGEDEHIDVVFSQSYWVNAVEFRSLYETDPSGQPEQLYIELYTGFSPGDDILGHDTDGIDDTPAQQWLIEAASGTVCNFDNGIRLVNFTTPILLNANDALVFRAVADRGEFALASMDVTLVPVPAAVLLGFLGLSAAGIKLRKFA